MMNRLRSKPKAGIEREKRGKHMPIMLAIKMETMAMNLRGSASDFLLQLFLLLDWHPSDCATTCM